VALLFTERKERKRIKQMRGLGSAWGLSSVCSVLCTAAEGRGLFVLSPETWGAKASKHLCNLPEHHRHQEVTV